MIRIKRMLQSRDSTDRLRVVKNTMTIFMIVMIALNIIFMNTMDRSHFTDFVLAFVFVQVIFLLLANFIVCRTLKKVKFFLMMMKYGASPSERRAIDKMIANIEKDVP